MRVETKLLVNAYGVLGQHPVQLPHWDRSQFATARGSNLTQVPIRKDGILPAFASLKIVILETLNRSESCRAFRAC